MSNHVMQAKRKDEKEKNVLSTVQFFDERGLVYKDEYVKDVKNNVISNVDHKRYAKAEFYTDGEVRCYIKRYRGGRVGEHIVDPAAILFGEKDLKAFNEQFGERYAEYYKVNRATFEIYVNYLSNRNPMNFKVVERRYLDQETE